MRLFILMVQKRLKNATKELFAGLRALDEQGATTIFLRKDLQKLV